MPGSMCYDPRLSTERGFSLSVTPAFGASATGGAEALFGQGLPAGPTATTGSGSADGQPGARLETEQGYGFRALGGSAVQISWAGWSVGRADRAPGLAAQPQSAAEGAAVRPKAGAEQQRDEESRQDRRQLPRGVQENAHRAVQIADFRLSSM